MNFLFVYNILMNYLKSLFETPKKKQETHQSKLSKTTSYSTLSSNKNSSSSKKKLYSGSYEEEISKILSQRKEFLNPMMAISYHSNPVKIIVGRGQYFYDGNHNKILDCINNVSSIGHCHPYYVMKMQKQLSRLLTNSRFLYDELM